MRPEHGHVGDGGRGSPSGIFRGQVTLTRDRSHTVQWYAITLDQNRAHEVKKFPPLTQNTRTRALARARR